MINRNAQELKQRDDQIRATIMQRLVETGEKERFNSFFLTIQTQVIKVLCGF